MKPTAFEDAETGIARTETRSMTIEACRMSVPPRNFELCPLESLSFKFKSASSSALRARSNPLSSPLLHFSAVLFCLVCLR